MADNIVPFNQSSSFAQGLTSQAQGFFDPIKRFDEDGAECWYGRELMPVLGYAKWQRFQDAIERAKLSCENSGLNPDAHFIHLPGVLTSTGRSGDDYRFSTIAALFVILECDTKKTAVQAAKAYFIKSVVNGKDFIGKLFQAITGFEIPEDLIQDKTLHVYAIQNLATGSIKLGISRNPEKRLKSLQTGSDAPLVLLAQKIASNGFADEKALHEKFASFKIQGEWFEAEVTEDACAELKAKNAALVQRVANAEQETLECAASLALKHPAIVDAVMNLDIEDVLRA